MRKFLPILTVAALITVACLVSPRRPVRSPGAAQTGHEPASVATTAGANQGEPATARDDEPAVAVHANAAIFPMGRFQRALAFDPSAAASLPEGVDPQATSEVNLDAPLAAIMVEGNTTISTEELLKLVKTQPGRIVDSKEIKNDVRTLFATRKFFDIEARLKTSPAGPVLVFRITERPPSPGTNRQLVEKVTFIGNKKFSDERLTELTQLKPGLPNDVEENRASCGALEYVYHICGYPNAKVVLEKGGSRDDREIIVRIDEGTRAVITKVSITGNASVAESVLKNRLQTVAQGTSFFSEDSEDDPLSKIDEDVADLKRHYQDRGFFDVQVSHRKSFSDDFSKASVEFVVEEGVRFKIRNIEFVGNDALSEQQLRANLKARPGEFFDQRLVNRDKSQIAAQYGELGRLFATVDPRTRSFEEPGFVDLVFDINEDRAYSLGPVLMPVAEIDDVANSPIELASYEVAAPNATTAEPPALRNIDRLLFKGVEAFDVSDVRNSVDVDFDLHLAAHPNSDMFQYLKTLEAVIQSGYRHGGFAEAIVEIYFNSTRGQIEVHVTEGPRVYCGDVQVTGEKSVAADAIVSSLTDDERPRRTVWKKREPAPLDDEAVARIRSKIETVFADAGYFHPIFDVAIDTPPAVPTANLKVSIKTEGPRALVGNVEVTGSKRDSAADVLTYLDLRSGSPFDANSTWRLRRRLSESGRYLVHEVTDQVSAKEAGAGVELHDLKIRLRDYKQAKPLVQERSSAEQALLKLSHWLKRWSQGEIDEDLVVTATSESENADERLAAGPLGTQIEFRMIVSPRHGQTISLKARPANDVPPVHVVFAAYPDRLVLASPQRKAKLVLPYSSESRLRLEMTGESASERSIDRDGRPFRLNLGMGCSANKKATASVFDAKVDFSAACITSFAHQDDSKCELRDGTWHIRNEAFEVQIDAESGRLVEYRLPLGELGAGLPAVVCRPQKQALKSELQALDQSLADLPTAYDSASPWISIAEFLADEMLAVIGPEAASDQANSLRAVRKLIGHWSPPGIGQLGDADSDKSPQKREPFWIPSQRAGWSYDDLFVGTSPARKNFAGDFLPIYRRLVPATGWMWPVGRDAALGWGSRQTPAGARLRPAPMSLEIGPAGELCLGFLGTYLNVDLTEPAGRAGMRRLAAEAFAKDYRPLLEGDSWLGKWLLSLAAALRHLDQSELEALVHLLREDAPREAIASSLALLKHDPDRPVAEVLPAVFDRLWSESLRLEAETVFLDWLRTSIGKSNWFLDQVRPASAKADDDESLGILEPLGKSSGGAGKLDPTKLNKRPQRTKTPEAEIPAIED